MGGHTATADSEDHAALGAEDVGARSAQAELICPLSLSSHLPGIYACAKCGYELFSSRSKYAHSSPWPAFTETIHTDSVAKRPEHNRPEALKVGAAAESARGVGQGRPKADHPLLPPTSSGSLESILSLSQGSCPHRLSGEPGSWWEQEKRTASVCRL